MASFLDTVNKRPQFRNIHVTQILGYRLPPAGMVSILHRISGVLMFVALAAVLWLFELSLLSEISFERLKALSQSVWMKLVFVALIWALAHHLVAGVRYLLLDLHIGIDKQQATRSAFAVFAISVPLAALAALRVFGVI
jgi:succinate dehydrogenase / fumarate reductase, cytochrome b subunit